MKLLLDGDILRYQIGYSVESKDYEPPMPVDEVKAILDSKMDTLLTMSHCDTYEVFLGGGTNYRHEMNPEYKGGRSAPKPFHFTTLGDLLYRYYDAYHVTGVEVDDVLSILANSSDDYVIGTIDKDLMQCPGWHFNWQYNLKEHLSKTTTLGHLVLEKGKLRGSGKCFLYAQTLMGDRVDNYFGIPNMGPVKTFTLLNGLTTEEELYRATYNEYLNIYGDEKEFLKNINMAYMLQGGELVHDDSNGITVVNPRLWTPPSNMEVES